jgi:hypothetical protein
MEEARDEDVTSVVGVEVSTHVDAVAKAVRVAGNKP